MKAIEWALAGAFAIGGARSMGIWSRRRFEGTDVVDHVLYALFVTARIGLWFAFAGLFAIYASIDVRGQAAVDEAARFRWYLGIPLVLAAVQLGAGFLLGRRGGASG